MIVIIMIYLYAITNPLIKCFYDVFINRTKLKDEMVYHY